MLTAIRIAGNPIPRHFMLCLHAVSSTHAPMVCIRPVCSAIGMNWRAHEFPVRKAPPLQASTPTISPVFQIDLGLILYGKLSLSCAW
jgi:hypothetical protein